jgi:hypothetical protein
MILHDVGAGARGAGCGWLGCALHAAPPPPPTPSQKTKGASGSAVLQLTDETFDAAIAENDPLLVAFTAPW